jgi:hypothetical protein
MYLAIYALHIKHFLSCKLSESITILLRYVRVVVS